MRLDFGGDPDHVTRPGFLLLLLLLGPFSSSTLDFLRDLGRRICHISGDDREVLFLFQRISVTIQRFNSVLLHDSFSIDRPDH